MYRKIKFNKYAVSALLCMAACVWQLGGIATAELVDRIVVVVNDDIILMSDLEQALSGIRIGLEKQGYSQSEQERIVNSRRSKVLDQLIYDTLTDQQVKRHNLKVKEDEVAATIERIRVANKLSEQELRRALELDGMTYESYREQIKENMLRARLVNREVKSKIVITDSEIKAHYDAQAEKYTGSTKYQLRHILLRFSSSADDAEKSRVLEQMNTIRKRLKDGEDFGKLAELYSEAPTASQGGQLGVFATHSLTEEIAQTLKGLKARQFSEAVEMAQGYQIFYVEEIISTGGKSIEEAAPEIREKLYAEIVDKKFNNWIEDLRKRSHIQILDDQ